jgi:pimeloyl-ACP methyl ester carboxylesterase
LIQHGLLDSSDGWVCNTEDNCIPFILANKGFDIWLSNSRGNKHSKHHKTISPLSREFWAFSFHEMGTIDLPAIIDYILKNNTISQKIIYIGHSQGTSLLFSGITMLPNYFNTKIKLFIALAPVARLTYMKSEFLKFLKNVKFHKLLKTINQFEVFPDNEQSSNFNRWISKKLPCISNMALEMISDDNINQSNNNMERVSVYLSHYPAGASLQSINHFIQIMENNKFIQYDYKLEANMRIYGSPYPQEYDFSKVNNIPIALFGGKEDKLASVEDIEWLREQLDTNVIFYNIYEKMGHLTFLLSKDMCWFEDALVLIEAFRGDILSEEIELINLCNNNNIEKRNSILYEFKKKEDLNIIKKEIFLEDDIKLNLQQQEFEFTSKINSTLIMDI